MHKAGHCSRHPSWYPNQASEGYGPHLDRLATDWKEGQLENKCEPGLEGDGVPEASPLPRAHQGPAERHKLFLVKLLITLSN